MLLIPLNLFAAAPTAVTPANTISSYKNIEYKFDINGNTVPFSLVVRENATNGSIVVHQTGITHSNISVTGNSAYYTNSTSLIYGKTYYWCVKGDTSSWSSWKQFQVSRGAAPNLITPSASATTDSRQVTFVWGTGCTVPYVLVIRENATNGNIILNNTISDTEKYTLGASEKLSYGIKYYWTVRSDTSVWAGWRLLQVERGIAPNLIIPADASSVNSQQPTFVWGTGCTVPYVLVIRENATNGNIILNNTISDTEKYTLGASEKLSYGIKYYWTVRSETSVWAAWKNFTVERGAGPIALDPGLTSDTTSSYKNIEYKFDINGNTVPFSLVVRENAANGSIVVHQTGITHSNIIAAGDSVYYTNSTSLTYGKTYYWCVRSDTSLWSSWRQFTVDRGSAPSQDTPVATDISAGTPTLIWLPAGNVTPYVVVVRQDSALGTIVLNKSNINDTQYSVSVSEKLTYGKVYYWTVRSDTSGWASWTVFSVGIANNPAPIEPNSTALSALKPVYIFSGQLSQAPFTIAVRKNSTNGQLVLAKYNINDTMTSPLLSEYTQEPQQNTLYYWTVRANETSWAAWKAFTTAEGGVEGMIGFEKIVDKKNIANQVSTKSEKTKKLNFYYLRKIGASIKELLNLLF